VAFRLTAALSWSALCVPLLGGRGAAQAPSPATDADARYAASATVVRPLVATNREDPSAAGTEIDARARVAAHETVSDVLLEVPGSRPFRTGALGSFTSASLRGAEVEHTAVLLGDIPISSADAAAFNLSAIPLSLLDRVVVYRGGAPAWVSQGAIGGVIQLVPRSAQGSRLSATTTAGSFSTYGVSAESNVTPVGQRAPLLLASAGFLSSSGDFPFKFDNYTSFDTTDDYVTRRKNADLVEGHGLLHVRQPLGPGTLELLLLGLSRVGGEPGPPSNALFTARHNFTRGLLGLGYTYERSNADGERELRLQVMAAGSFEQALAADLYKGLVPNRPTLADSLGTRGLGRAAGSLALTHFLELTLVASAQRERRAIDDPFARPPMPASSRTSAAGVAELNLHGRVASHAYELRPSMRVEHSAATLESERFASVVARDVSLTLPTYRLAFAFELTPDLALSASAASGRRTPSMLELFGDGALILGNAALASERSQSYDLGLVESLSSGAFSGTFELRVFALEIRDQIIFVRDSFMRSTPINFAHSQIRGIEGGARLVWGRLWLNGAATVLATEGLPGKRLPDRPLLNAFAQPGLNLGAVGLIEAINLFVESSFASQSYQDPSNQTQPKPSVLLFGAGTALLFLGKWAELRLTVSDIFDRGGQDLIGFPFPGRTVMASLTYKEGA
jgi:vitamin B12 transporter